MSGADGSSLTTLVSLSSWPTHADFDGDGRSDLFRSETTGVSIVSGRTGTPLYQQAPGTHPLTIVPIGDENGDGCDDAGVFTGASAPTLRLVRGPLGSVLGPWGNTHDLGDVTGDGKTDFFCGNTISAPFLMAGGTLTNAGSIPISLSDQGVGGMGDLNGDGHADYMIRHLFYPSVPYQFFSGATFGSLPAPFVQGNLFSLGDIDGDGRPEWNSNGSVFEWVDPAVPIASRMVRRGTGGTTIDARKPTLVARGHCGLGDTAFFDLRGCLPNGLALLMFGASVDVDLATLGAPGNRCYTSLAGGCAFVANDHGIAQFQATMPNTPTLLGASLSLQSVVVDPAANALGLLTSNAIDITTNN